MKRALQGGLAICVGCLALVGVATEGRERAVAAQRPDAPPKIVNAQLDARPAATGLDRTFTALTAGQTGAAWIGYSVPAVPGDHATCDDCGPGRCGTAYLEGRRRETSDPARTTSPEAPRPMAVLFRVERAVVQKIRVFSSDCELDAGGLPVHWLTSVNAAESVSLLAGFVAPGRESNPGSSPLSNQAMAAVALHADPAAFRTLERFVAPGQAVDVRKRAAFWLGSTRGREGFSVLRRLAETDMDTAFRRELVFPLSLSSEPAGIDVLIRLARTDSNGEVRKQALFWLGQKAGAKVAGTLADAVANDPETAIKERAVFALSRLPNGEGVAPLIEAAQSNPNLLVRKRALFWLGQSNDPRALDYLARVLTGK